MGDHLDVQANGIRFAYLEEGEGPLVLLLHGFPDTARSWDFLRPKLAEKGYRAVSPWLRGYAPTEIPMRDTDGRPDDSITPAVILPGEAEPLSKRSLSTRPMEPGATLSEQR